MRLEDHLWNSIVLGANPL